MGSDDEIDYSIHDLDNVPEFPLQIDERNTRHRSFSDGHVVRISRGADEFSDESDYGRARVWSSGGVSSSFRRPLSPESERKVHTRSGLLRRSLSRNLSEPGEALQIPEEDAMSEDFSSGSLSSAGGSNLSPRLSLPSHNKSKTDDPGTESENPLRQSLQKYSMPEIPQSKSSRFAMASPTSDSYGDEEDDSSFYADRYSDRDEGTNSSIPTLVVWGIPLPAWFSKRRPSWNRVAACVVMNAPCFWCFRLSQKTDRAIVQRLNILCAFFAFFQVLSAALFFVYIAGDMAEHDVTDYDPTGDLTGPDSSTLKIKLMLHIWNINGAVFSLGIISFIVFATTILTVPVVRSVNLLGAIRYLWILLWIIPFQIYFVIGLFDYFRVTKVWVKHWWRDESLSSFRRAFCEPSSTYNTLCAAPEVNNVTSWCLANFNATDCEDIRDEAQEKVDRFMIAYYYGTAIWGIFLILLLMLVVRILESIISRPLVQKSRESNVPAWFSLPILGCIGNGLLFIFSTSSELVSEADRSSTFWVGPIYVSTGGFFFLAAILGWFISSYSILNTRDKRYKMLAINLFIVVIAIVFILLIWIVGGSIAFSISLAETPLSSEARGNIACFLDQANTCTGCNQDPSDNPSTRCPEWTTDDVTKILQTQAKSSASLAAIFLLYALSAMRFGFSTRRYIRLYQIDYV